VGKSAAAAGAVDNFAGPCSRTENTWNEWDDMVRKRLDIVLVEGHGVGSAGTWHAKMSGVRAGSVVRPTLHAAAIDKIAAAFVVDGGVVAVAVKLGRKGR
jgi:hypothetical protein